MTTIIFLIVLAVLIFVHELGHFVFARMNKIRVDEFKIGFGPRVFSWTKGETKYGLNLIPFGGYVKIHGENPDEESTHGKDKDRSFVNKKPWQQLIVLVAGVLFNFIFAWLLYVCVFISGVTASPLGFENYDDYFSNQRVLVTQVSDNSPAQKAGLKIGDVILGIGTKNDMTIEEIQKAINDSAGQNLPMQYKRGDNVELAEMLPIQGLVENRYAIGIAMSDVVDIKLPFFSAIYEGLHYTGFMIKETVLGLYDFFGNIFKGQADFASVSGPVGIAGVVGGAAEMGFTYLLMITAIISINLGVINLIPFPALDGGRALFVIIETITRKKMAPVYANWMNTIGFILLMALMVVVTYKDIVKIIK